MLRYVRKQPGPIVAAPPKAQIEDLRAVCAGDASEAEAIEMCSYKEYDGDLGEWFGCRLSAHGPKVKHVRGAKL